MEPVSTKACPSVLLIFLESPQTPQTNNSTPLILGETHSVPTGFLAGACCCSTLCQITPASAIRKVCLDCSEHRSAFLASSRAQSLRAPPTLLGKGHSPTSLPQLQPPDSFFLLHLCTLLATPCPSPHCPPHHATRGPSPWPPTSRKALSASLAKSNHSPCLMPASLPPRWTL